MRFRFFLVIFAMIVGTAVASAQRRGKHVARTDTSRIVKAYIDSIAQLRVRIDSMAARTDSSGARRGDGRYYRLFAPLTFYHSPAAKTFELKPGRSGRDKVSDEVDKVLLNVYLSRPDLVSNSEDHLKKAGSIRDEIDQPIKHDINLVETPDRALRRSREDADDRPKGAPVRLMLRRPNFWTFSGDHDLQFLQNFISENWHKGGESNYALMASVVLNANYDNKQRLKWDNKLELKLGFQNSRSDTLHKFRPTEDLIRYTGKLGLQAANRWYYTVQLLAYTQFTRGLKSNDEKVYSDFMSPFNLNIGLGMDYSVETKNKRLTGTVNLSVLSFNFKYVDRKDLAADNGVVGDHHTVEDFGSQLTTNLTWNVCNMIKWETRLYAFTTYKHTLVEWENTLTLSVSRFISAKIFFYPRFDDSTTRDDDWNYWQFKEYSSVGFSYSF